MKVPRAVTVELYTIMSCLGYTLPDGGSSMEQQLVPVKGKAR